MTARAALTAIAVAAIIGAIHVAPVALAAATGIVLALVEAHWPRTPSTVALDIGLLVPWPFALAIVLGGASELTPLARWRHRVPLAAGLVAGEAIAGTLAAIC